MASPEVLALVGEMMAAMKPGVSIADQRAAYDRCFTRFPLVEGTTIAPVSAGGVPAEWIAAPGAGSAVILYFHGGGYMIGSLASYRGIGSRLSSAAGARVLNVDYRLAPEHRFPAPVEDALASYRYLLKEGVAPGQIVIAGDSAGGGLTLAALIALREAGDPLPAAGVTLSAWTDLTAAGESLVSRAARDPWVVPAGLRAVGKTYLGGADPRHPHASPLFADLAGLPPLLMQVGSEETLFDDTSRFADRARAAGVDVTVEEVPEMIHVFQMFAPIEPAARAAIDRIGAFVRQHTDRKSVV